MTNKNKLPRKKYIPNGVQKIIRFASQEDVDLIQRAADRRGLSFTAFVRMACVATASKVIAAPPDPFFETLSSVLDDGAAA
jgi:hypothetical protein